MLLTPAQVERFKKLSQTKQEIWQIVVRKLRVWSASSEGAEEGEEAIPCRPFAILVNNIYPMGQVMIIRTLYNDSYTIHISVGGGGGIMI
jgi:hypothetical protein